jgi:hypothetical protein
MPDSGSQSISLGPWPLGVNNVDDEGGRFFAVPGQGAPPAQLRAAVNLDLDREGWLRRRVGRTKRLDLVDGHSGMSIAGIRLHVSDGDLVQVQPGGTPVVLVSGVGSGRVQAIEVAGQVWWTNGSRCGRLVNLVAQPWGLAQPTPPMVSVVPGSMATGTYLVAITTENADELESGAHAAVPITLAQDGAIRLEGLPSDQPWINIYASGCNGRDLFWAARIPAQASFTLTQVDVSTDLLDSVGLCPPPPGQALTAFAGRILVAAGSALYWSQPVSYHHFRLATDVQLFAQRIDLLAALPDGFYVRAGTETVWIQGDDPETWSRRVVDDRPGAEGVLYVPARKFPQLQADGLVPMWVSADGPVAGLPGGRLMHLTDGRLAVDTYAEATLAYREENGLRQLLMSLRDKTAGTRLGATDLATCSVVRGGSA